MEKFGILLLGHGNSLPHKKKLVDIIYAEPLGIDQMIGELAF